MAENGIYYNAREVARAKIMCEDIASLPWKLIIPARRKHMAVMRAKLRGKRWKGMR